MPPSYQISSDHDPLDLARTLVDPRHPDVAERALDREVADVAVAAVDLQRDVADLPRVLGREQLGHRGLLRERLAALLEERGAQGHEVGRVEPGRGPPHGPA